MSIQIKKGIFNPPVEDTGWERDLRPELRRQLLLKAYIDPDIAAQAIRDYGQRSNDGYRDTALKDAKYLNKMNSKPWKGFKPLMTLVILMVVSAVLSSPGGF